MEDELRKLGEELGITEYLEMIIKNQEQIVAELQNGDSNIAVLLALQGQSLTVMVFLRMISRLQDRIGADPRLVLRSPHFGGRLMDFPGLESILNAPGYEEPDND